MPIISDPLNEKALKVQQFLLEALGDLQAPRGLSPDLYIVIGGDGFLLQCVRQFHAPERIFLGLNCGRLGFLLNELPEDLSTLPGLLMGPAPRIMTFPRIRMRATDVQGHVSEALALNDIYLERMTGQACHLRLQIGGRLVVSELVSDGLIISTALGSTAYTFSAGGVPCYPTLEVIGITAICPHVPRMTPLIFPLSATIEATVLQVERRHVRAVADGVDFNDVTHVAVSDARSPVQLAFFENHDFTATLLRKVLHV